MKNLYVTVRILLSVLLIIGGLGSIYFYSQSENYKSENQEANEKIETLKKEVAGLKKDKQEAGKEIKQLKIERTNRKVDSEETPSVEGVPRETGHASEIGLMIVTKPLIDDVVESPVLVTGRAIAFESTVNIRVKDDDSNILGEANTMTNAPDMDKFGDFFVEVSFKTAATKSGVIEAFEYSARDGSETNKVIIPVTFEGN